MDDFFIKKVCSGDIEAFRYFIQKYSKMCKSVAISIVKDDYNAEEVVQDSFIKAFKSLHHFKMKSKFTTWLYRIVVNEAFLRLKSMQKDILLFQHSYDENIIDESAINKLKEEDQKLLINNALNKLSAKESLALRLFYLQEESIKDLCTSTGWTPTNAKVILHRARKNLFIVINKMLSNENI